MSKPETSITQLADYKKYKDNFGNINPHKVLKQDYFKRFYRNLDNPTSAVYTEYYTEGGAAHKMTENQAEAFAALYLGTAIAKMQFGDTAIVNKNIIYKFFSDALESENFYILGDKFYRSLVSSMTSIRDRIRNLINSKDAGDILMLPEETAFEKDPNKEAVKAFSETLYDTDPVAWEDAQWSSPFEQGIESIFATHYDDASGEYVNIEGLYEDLYFQYKEHIGTESFAKRAAVASNARDRLYAKTGWKVKEITIDLAQAWFDGNSIEVSRALQPELWKCIDKLLKECRRVLDLTGSITFGTITDLLHNPTNGVITEYKKTPHYERGHAAFKANFVKTFGETVDAVTESVSKINAYRIRTIPEVEYSESIRQLWTFYQAEFC